MRFFKQPSLRNKLLCLLALASILLQVQSAFACQMMDVSGSTQDCCCGDLLDHPDPMLPGDADTNPCCEFYLELTFNELESATIPTYFAAQSEHDPPDFVLIHVLSHNTAPRVCARPASYRLADVTGSGNQTYLTTLRLRI